MGGTSQFGLLNSDFSNAIAVMLEKHGIACDLMHGFDWNDWSERRVGGPGLHRVGRVPSRGAVRLLQLIPAGQEHILEQDDGKKRGVGVMGEGRMANSECRTD